MFECFENNRSSAKTVSFKFSTTFIHNFFSKIDPLACKVKKKCFGLLWTPQSGADVKFHVKL